MEVFTHRECSTKIGAEAKIETETETETEVEAEAEALKN